MATTIVPELDVYEEWGDLVDALVDDGHGWDNAAEIADASLGDLLDYATCWDADAQQAAMDWDAIENKAAELFACSRNLMFDDSFLAALCWEREPALTARALRLLDSCNISFAAAFRCILETERTFAQQVAA